MGRRAGGQAGKLSPRQPGTQAARQEASQAPRQPGTQAARQQAPRHPGTQAARQQAARHPGSRQPGTQVAEALTIAAGPSVALAAVARRARQILSDRMDVASEYYSHCLVTI